MSLLRDLAAASPAGRSPSIPRPSPPCGSCYLGAMVVVAVLVHLRGPLRGALSWLERRIAGRIQARVGPNRVGPQAPPSGSPMASSASSKRT
jgi:hypothetical protein